MFNTREYREDIEREFLALVLNKNEVVDLIQINPKFLKNPANVKMLNYAIECYKNNKTIMPDLIAKVHRDFDPEYYIELLNEELWYPRAWKQQLDNAQKCILNFYKEDALNLYAKQLQEHQLNYEQYIEKINKVQNYSILEESAELSKNEMLESINEQKARININKFEKFNNILKLVQGDFLIIGATTGAGKSGLLINLMVDLMNSFQCIYFNMEMSKSTIYKRIIAVKSDIKVDNVEAPQTDFQKQLIDKSLDEIEQKKLIIEHKATDMVQIKRIIGQIKDKNRHTIIFVDHLGLIKIDGSNSLYEQATEVAKQLRQICLEYDCTIIASSQLNRGAYSSEEITLSMLKDSGELENSASKVVLLYKDKDSRKEDVVQKMIFDVAKNRDGFTGTINVLYDKEKQQFKETKGN